MAEFQSVGDIFVKCCQRKELADNVQSDLDFLTIVSAVFNIVCSSFLLLCRQSVEMRSNLMHCFLK